MDTYGSSLTDHDLVAAVQGSRVREYENAEAARAYAREYGARIIGQRVTDVRWMR